MTRRTRTAAVLAAIVLAATATPAVAQTGTVSEPFRPGYHHTPDVNWMNDPNGLVYYKGTYHLFYQYNPYGTTWGNMSWGHATSTDMVNWTEQPVAIPQTRDANGDSTEDIFSGSVVVDQTNSSGLGTATNPPLVAVYTSAYTSADPSRPNTQAQSLAYSLDDGRTWTKYSGNPVLEAGVNDFRDPKVFRYSGPAGTYWVMAAVRAEEHVVQLYRSDDLIHWSHLSDFGPANATEGQWECPDLFPLVVQGTMTTKWVMLVNVNPGGVNAGSAGQYFVGDFDGRTFTADNLVGSVAEPVGTTLAGFDGGLDGWTAAGGGTSPWTAATGSMPGQQQVSGFSGSGLVDGFQGGDATTGTLTSPAFTIQKPYLSFLVGGGSHPHVDGSQLGNQPPAGTLLFDGFEYAGSSTLADHGWDVTGDFQAALTPATQGGSDFIGQGEVNTFNSGTHGDDNRGDLTSPAFTISDSWLSFLIGGGHRDDGSLEVELLDGDTVVRRATGDDSGALNWTSWNVDDLRGKSVRLRVHDAAGGGWGHLTLDNVVMGPEKASSHSTEVAANLVVDGKVVRTATGRDSEHLDWQSWDVRDLVGRTAQVQLVDNNTEGWGHLLFDQLMATDAPARSRLAAYDWIDWGRDDYATTTFSNMPDGSVTSIGWMNNWDYAGRVPTTTWRSANTLPRKLSLVQTATGPKLVQKPVDQVASLAQSPVLTQQPYSLTGTKQLPARADMARIDVDIQPGTASSVGLDVFASATGRTTIGYDATTHELSIDRRSSGTTGFSTLFPSVDVAPVQLQGGHLRLSVYLDRASVEVFAQGGRRTITDLVYPDAGANQLAVWSRGGTAKVSSLTVTPMSAMASRR